MPDKIGGILGLIFVTAMVIAWIVLGDQREAGIWPFAGILFGLCGIAEAFFPKIGWELEKFRLSFWANGADDLTPSTFYRWSRKAVIWLGVTVSAAVFFTLIFESGEPQAPPVVLLPH